MGCYHVSYYYQAMKYLLLQKPPKNYIVSNVKQKPLQKTLQKQWRKKIG